MGGVGRWQKWGGEEKGVKRRRGEEGKSGKRIVYRLHSYRTWGGDKTLPLHAWGHEVGPSTPMQKLRGAACIYSPVLGGGMGREAGS